MKRLVPAILLLSCPAALMADFSYQTTTKITGGAMASMVKIAGAFSKKAAQPVNSTVMLKDNRMVHVNQDSAQIVDLDKETITSVDFDKKTYSTITFAEMREQMQKAMDSMKNHKDAQGTDVKFKVSSKETGQVRHIAGYDTHEVLLTVEMDANNQEKGAQGSMNLDSHLWLASDIPGYREVRDFNKRMVEKLGLLSPDQAMQMRQAMSGMVEMNKAMAKMNGVPVMTVMEMSAAGMQSGAQGGNGAQPQAQAQNQDSQSSGIAALARLGGFGRKKKSQDADQQPGDSQNAAAPGVLMQMTTESSGFSSAPVDGSKFEVPAGFKQIAPRTR